MAGLPLLFGATGPVPTPPLTILQAIIALVEGIAPGYTAALPGSLIEDLSSTELGAVVQIDQARVDAVNNCSPYGANAYLLAAFGVMLGIPQGLAENGNALVVFSGTPGYAIPPGFTVGDGTRQYIVIDGATVGLLGSSPNVEVISTTPGIFPIAPNSITTILTSVPSPFTLTVTNPQAGVPATTGETTQQYRARILEGTNVSIQGEQSYVKTLVKAVPGVSPIRVSVIPGSPAPNWEVIVGGGDPNQVAGAIYQSVSNITLLASAQGGGGHGSGTTVTASVIDPPNSYTVRYVTPAQVEITIAVSWNTTLASFVAVSAVNQFIVAAVQSYINGLEVGAAINLMVMTEVIAAAVAPVLSADNLTTLTFVVTDSTTHLVLNPSAGTSIIPAITVESYWYVSPTDVTSTQA